MAKKETFTGYKICEEGKIVIIRCGINKIAEVITANENNGYDFITFTSHPKFGFVLVFKKI